MKHPHHLQFDVLAAKLKSRHILVAPTISAGRLVNARIEAVGDIDWSGRLSENAWKEWLLPPREKILDFVAGRARSTSPKYPPMALVGVNIKDLRAMALFDLAFKGDKHYEARRRSLFIVGFGLASPGKQPEYSEADLEHARFDIFISRSASKRTAYYAGSKKGENLLKSCHIADYVQMPFSGAVAHGGPDKRMMFMADKMAHSADHALWDVLDKICLACGKCSNACPTCFCFNLDDSSDPKDLGRTRVRTSCFFSDFSLVAGGHRDLDTVKKKIYFWYVHKFVRIPREYKVPGCVSCGRCVAVCPVGINIFKNLGKIAKIKTGSKK